MGRGGGGGGGVEMEEELQDTQVHIGFTQILFLYTICMHPPPSYILNSHLKCSPLSMDFHVVSVYISFFSVHMYSVPVPPHTHAKLPLSGCEFNQKQPKVRLHQHSYKVRQTLLTPAVRLPVYLVYRSGLYKLGP